MLTRFARSELGKLVILAGVLTAIWAAALVPAMDAARPESGLSYEAPVTP